MPRRFSHLAVKQDELFKLREKSDNVTNESVLKTREMLMLMDECQDAGVNTLQNLYEQGEKLNKAEAGLDATGVELDKAGLRVNNISAKEKAKWYLLPCTLCCQKDPDKVYPNKTNEVGKDFNSEKQTSNRAKRDITTEQIFRPDEGSTLFPKVNGNNTVTSPDQEIHNNIGHVSNHLYRLKDIAGSLNVETEKQNVQLDRLKDKANTNLSKLNAVTKNTINLLHDGKPPGKPTSLISRLCPCCNIL